MYVSVDARCWSNHEWKIAKHVAAIHHGHSEASDSSEARAPPDPLDNLRFLTCRSHFL